MEKISLPFERFAMNLLQDALTSNRNVLLYADACALFYCQQGEAVVRTNGRTIRIKPGDVYIYLPSSYVKVESTTPDFYGVTYKTSVSYAMGMLENTSYTSSILTLRENPCISLTEQQRALLEELLEAIDRRTRLFNTLKSDDDNKVFMQISLSKLGEVILHEIFYYVFSNQPAAQPILDSKELIYQTFLTSLIQNHKHERAIEFYAHEQHLTPRYFSSVIMKKTGRTAKQWITQVTINSIKQSLLYSGKSIKEISSAFNFTNQSFFGKYFKQAVGLSPTEFREQAEEEYRRSMEEKQDRINQNAHEEL